MRGGKCKAQMLTGLAPGLKIDEQQLIKSLTEDSQYKFLGVLESVKQEDSLVLESAERVYLQRLSVIWSSPLSDHHKVVATNQFALPVLVYFIYFFFVFYCFYLQFYIFTYKKKETKKRDDTHTHTKGKKEAN